MRAHGLISLPISVCTHFSNLVRMPTFSRKAVHSLKHEAPVFPLLPQIQLCIYSMSLTLNNFKSFCPVLNNSWHCFYVTNLLPSLNPVSSLCLVQCFHSVFIFLHPPSYKLPCHILCCLCCPSVFTATSCLSPSPLPWRNKHIVLEAVIGLLRPSGEVKKPNCRNKSYTQGI